MDTRLIPWVCVFWAGVVTVDVMAQQTPPTLVPVAAQPLVSVEAGMPGAARQYRLTKPARTAASVACNTSSVIRIAPQSGEEIQRALGEMALITSAVATGRNLIFEGARCDPDGALVATKVSIEPEPSEPKDLCAMPYAREKLAQCK